MTASPIAQVVTVARYEIRKYIRGRRLLGILILVGLIIGLFLGLPPALGIKYASTPNAFVSTFATFAGLVAVLGGVLFAADALVSEHEKRTGYFLFPNPVRREVLVLGYMMAVVGVAYLLSALLKSTVAATVLTFFLFTFIFTIIAGILTVAKVHPWFIPTSASAIIT